MPWFVWVVVVTVGLVTVDRLLLRAEVKGWIYYRRRKPSRTSVGNALLQLQQIFEPDKQHVVDERLRDDAEIEIAGDDEPG